MTRRQTIKKSSKSKACAHDPARARSWFALDSRAVGGRVLCVACCDCGKVLKGGV